ncbi:hypothetical protein [Pseudomonas putida]
MRIGPLFNQPMKRCMKRAETTCHLDAAANNFFVLAITLQSKKRFSHVGQFDKRPGRFLVLWLLNNDQQQACAEEQGIPGPATAPPPFY